MKRFASAPIVFALCAFAPAKAHVVLKQPTAISGSYYIATLLVTHGCGVSPTVALRVTIPEDIYSAKPMPKPGWMLEIAREKLAAPVKLEHGSAVERVKEIVWHGGALPNDQFDEFSISVRLPSRVGPVYFPAVQVCAKGKTRWVEVPPEGKSSQDMTHPPPAVILRPAQRP